MRRQTGLFRSSTYRPSIAKGIRLGSPWGAVALCANLLWNLGPRTSFGPALIAAVFPLLIVAANVGHRSQWRLSLCHTVSFSIPACTLFLFLTLLPPRGDLPADPIEKLAAILYEVAEFLRENAITTTAGLAVLLAAHRTSPPKAEGNAFRTAIVVAGLALLSVSTFCALTTFCLLRLI